MTVFHLLECLKRADHAGRVVASIVSVALPPTVGLELSGAAVVKLVQLKKSTADLADRIAAAQNRQQVNQKAFVFRVGNGLRNVPAGDMRRFMADDAGQRIVVRTDFIEQSPIDVNVAARDRERVDFRTVNHADPERNVRRFFLSLSEDRGGDVKDAAVRFAVHDKPGLRVDLGSIIAPKRVFLLRVHYIIVNLSALATCADNGKTDDPADKKASFKLVIKA